MEHFIGDHLHVGCPELLLTQDRLEVIAEYKRWTRFGFPYPGPYGNQPANLIDAFDELEDASAAIDVRKLQRPTDDG